MGAAKDRRKIGTRLYAATLAFVLLVLPGFRTVQAASRSCAMHRAPQLRCHETPRGAGGHSTTRACCRRGHGLSAAVCGCEHRGDPASVSNDEYVPVKLSRHRVVPPTSAFYALALRGFERIVDPPDPPPPIASSPPLS
jgi:hypothetical protein